MAKEVDYQNPPIVEVAIGASFKRVPGFKIPHFGAFWKVLPRSFTDVEDRYVSIGPGEEINLARPKLRTWFLTEDGRKLIQLQQDRFIFNWRRMNDDDAGDYPEFDNIFPEFLSHFQGFEDFLSENSLGQVELEQLELVYVNIIPEDGPGTILGQPTDVLVDHVRQQGKRFLPEPSEFAWVTKYMFPDEKGILTVDGRSVRRGGAPEDQLIKLEIAARSEGGIPSKEAMNDWFSVAHDFIVKAFADVTDRHIQQDVWGKK